MSEQTAYRLTILPTRDPHGVDPVLRLRRLLKALCRGYSFRVARVEEVTGATVVVSENWRPLDLGGEVSDGSVAAQPSVGRDAPALAGRRSPNLGERPADDGRDVPETAGR